MVNFIEENVNPKNKKTGDCVIRALSRASGVPYFQVVDELVDIFRQTGYMLNCKQGYERWLEAKGFTKMRMPRKFDGRRYTVAEMDKVISNDYVAVISIANHLVAYEQSAIYDIWDCRYKSSGNYYIRRK